MYVKVSQLTQDKLQSRISTVQFNENNTLINRTCINKTKIIRQIQKGNTKKLFAIEKNKLVKKKYINYYIIGN